MARGLKELSEDCHRVWDKMELALREGDFYFTGDELSQFIVSC